MRTIAAAALTLALASCGGDGNSNAGSSSSGSTLGGNGPAEMLPDLDQVAPGAVSVVVEDGRERLVFSSAVENVGRGPLVVAGSRAETLEPEMSSRQLVRQVGGGTTEYPLRLRLRFVVSETHRHWHVLGFERYELDTLAGDPIGDDRKTGFCLGDRYDARASARIPGEPRRAVWTHNCAKDAPGRLRIVQGISPGYGDDYVPRLEGQYIDVTGLDAGRFVLVHRVNVEGDIRESSYENNAASVLLELRRPPGEPPKVRVLESCQASERCGT